MFRAFLRRALKRHFQVSIMHSSFLSGSQANCTRLPASASEHVGDEPDKTPIKIDYFRNFSLLVFHFSLLLIPSSFSTIFTIHSAHSPVMAVYPQMRCLKLKKISFTLMMPLMMPIISVNTQFLLIFQTKYYVSVSGNDCCSHGRTNGPFSSALHSTQALFLPKGSAYIDGII